MKSIFLALIITTSFSPLIFASDASPSGAAAAVAVAAENLVAEKLFCMLCKKDRELIPCRQHAEKCNCNYRKTCHWCKKRLVPKLMAETILAEQAAKEKEAAAAEQRAQAAATEAVEPVAQARKAKKAVGFLKE
jgi:hypothetical protein